MGGSVIMDLSALGPSAAVVIVVLAFLRFMQSESQKRDAVRQEELIKQDEQHKKMVETLERSIETSEKSIQVGEETYRFMKNLNGKLERALQDRVMEG